MKVKLVSHSTPTAEYADHGITDVQELIAFCARVSNPSNQFNTETSDKLINYLLKHKHFSPLEMVHACVEIETTRDIARQMLRHASFRFQEFCITGDSKITLLDSNSNTLTIPISDLYKLNQDELIAYDIPVYDDGIKFTKIREVFSTGVKPCFKITLETGNTISCTKEHKFLSRNGFDTLENIIELSIVDNMLTSINFTEKEIMLYSGEFSTIVKVESIGDKETYDLEVQHSSHNYIANGIVVHNSQRYADPVKDLSFVIREARLQDHKNRQNSIITEDDELQNWWESAQQEVIDLVTKHYKEAVSRGVAKECARVILPEGNTVSRLYMAGSIRSWVHYIDVRAEVDTQLEHRVVALACAKAIAAIFPMAENFADKT